MSPEQKDQRTNELMDNTKAVLVEMLIAAEEANGGDVTELNIKLHHATGLVVELTEKVADLEEKLNQPAPVDQSAEVAGLKIVVAEQAAMLKIHAEVSPVHVGHHGGNGYRVKSAVRQGGKTHSPEEISNNAELMAYLIKKGSDAIELIVVPTEGKEEVEA